MKPASKITPASAELSLIATAISSQERGASAFLNLLERMASEISELRLLVRGAALEARDGPAVAEPLMVSMKEASRLSGLCVSSLYEMIRLNRLDSRKAGGKRLVVYKSLKALMIAQDDLS